MYSVSAVLYFQQEPCSPSAEKHDAGLRKHSMPAVQHTIHSNNNIVMLPQADDRKTDKGWAQFEEDCQGMLNAWRYAECLKIIALSIS